MGYIRIFQYPLAFVFRTSGKISVNFFFYEVTKKFMLVILKYTFVKIEALNDSTEVRGSYLRKLSVTMLGETTL